VDERYLLAYRQIAAFILQHLFGVAPSAPKPLENLLVLWSRLDDQVKARLDKAGIDRGHTYYWEEAMKKGLLSMEDVNSLTEIRSIRNKVAHAIKIDSKQVEYAIEMAEKLLQKMDRTR
jgi:predicted DNA-binding protein